MSKKTMRTICAVTIAASVAFAPPASAADDAEFAAHAWNAWYRDDRPLHLRIGDQTTPIMIEGVGTYPQGVSHADS